VKGMVTVDGVTYRIERIDQGRYAAFSLMDDSELGVFRTCVPIEVEDGAPDPSLLERVGRAAIRSGRTSSTFPSTPPPPITEDRAEPAEEQAPLTPLRRAPA